jgi:CHAD domain-containing protein|tara:strand:- start:248 stop:430 length:183 start_codon:yes stop_codon:yes gene_type:complete
MIEDKHKILEKLHEELREARRTIDTAVWPNINDAMDFEHVHKLRKQIDEVRRDLDEITYV